MDREPDTENVHFIDEYPELAKKVWLRRLNAQRMGQLALFPEDPHQLVLEFPDRSGEADGDMGA